MNSLNALDEDVYEDEDDEAMSAPYNPGEQNLPAKLPKSQANDVAAMEKQMRNTSLSHAAQVRQAAAPKKEEKGYGQHSAAVTAAAKRQVKNKGPFELTLDNATMLGRRKNKGPSGLSQVTAGGS